MRFQAHTPNISQMTHVLQFRFMARLKSMSSGSGDSSQNRHLFQNTASMNCQMVYQQHHSMHGIDLVVTGLQWVHVLVHLLLVFSRPAEDHASHLAYYFSAFEFEASPRPTAQSRKIEFVTLDMSGSGIFSTDDKIDAIGNYAVSFFLDQFPKLCWLLSFLLNIRACIRYQCLAKERHQTRMDSLLSSRVRRSSKWTDLSRVVRSLPFRLRSDDRGYTTGAELEQYDTIQPSHQTCPQLCFTRID